MMPPCHPHTEPRLYAIPRTGVPGAPGVCLRLLLTLALAFLPIGLFTLIPSSPLHAAQMYVEGAALVLLLLLCTYGTQLSRGRKGMWLLFIALPLLTVIVTRSMVPAACLVCLIFCIGLGALLIATASRIGSCLLLLLPAAAYILALLVVRQALVPLLCLAPVPPAVVLALGTRSSASHPNGLTRVGVICLTSAAGGVVCLACVAAALYDLVGTIQPAALTKICREIQAELIRQLTSLTANLPTSQAAEQLFSPEAAAALVADLFNLLPAFIIVCLNFVSAFSQYLLFGALRAFGYGSSVTPRVRRFRMSLPSAILFPVSYLLALILSGDANATAYMIGMVAENFAIILQPGMAAVGLLYLLITYRMRSSLVGARRPGCGFILILLLACFFVPVPVVLAFYGAGSTLFTFLCARLLRQKPPFDSQGPANRP